MPKTLSEEDAIETAWIFRRWKAHDGTDRRMGGSRRGASREELKGTRRVFARSLFVRFVQEELFALRQFGGREQRSKGLSRPARARGTPRRGARHRDGLAEISRSHHAEHGSTEAGGRSAGFARGWGNGAGAVTMAPASRFQFRGSHGCPPRDPPFDGEGSIPMPFSSGENPRSLGGGTSSPASAYISSAANTSGFLSPTARTSAGTDAPSKGPTAASPRVMNTAGRGRR